MPVTAIPKDFEFDTNVRELAIEAERRAVVMFGPNWREDCVIEHPEMGSYESIFHPDAPRTRLVNCHMQLRCLTKNNLNDLADGSPALLNYDAIGLHRGYIPAGSNPCDPAYVSSYVHYRDGKTVDATDGAPSCVRFNPNGTIKSAEMASGEHLDAREVSDRMDVLHRARMKSMAEASPNDLDVVGMTLPYSGTTPLERAVERSI